MQTPGQWTDHELMSRYQAGDASAFELLYSRHSGRVYSYLLKRLHSDAEQALELQQAVFLKFHQIRAQYRPEYEVLQWLFVIARTTYLDHVRKKGRQVSEIDDYPLEQIAAPEIEPSQNEGLLSLDSLTEEQREVLQARYLSEATYEAIAQQMGKSEAGVRKIVSRAIRKLRGEIKPEGAK